MQMIAARTAGPSPRRRRPAHARLLVGALLAWLLVVVPVPAADAAASTGTFFPLPPARILDTRSGVGAPAATIGAGGVLSFTVTGRGGVPATDVSAVVLNMTVVSPTAGSYMTVWPTGEAMPTASNLNYSAGQTVPNLVKAKVGAGGQVSVFNAAGSVHVLADVAGWYKSGADPAEGARFTALTPSRILDTRSGIGGATIVGPGATIDVQVTGQGGVPASGVSAVTLNVTVVGPSAPSSYLTAWPTGETRPTASNLNYVAGDVVPNLVIVKVGAGGKVSLYNDTGQTHVLADVVGWYSAAGGAGSVYAPLTPNRVLDTRTGNGTGAPGMVGPASTTNLQVTGRGGVPASGVTAVALNVTAVTPTAGSYLTAWPTGEGRPTASNLNYSAGQVVPNLVVVKVGAGGAVSLYNDAGQTHILADVVGWFGPPPTPPVEVSRSIAAGDHVFIPSTIVAPAGALVTMTFTNPDAEQHTFTSPPIGVDRTVDSGGQDVFTFTMPATETGFVCLIHQGEGMVGTLQPG